MKKRILSTIGVTAVAFVIWLLGELVLMFRYPDSSLTAARVWLVIVLVGATVWNIVHLHRKEKKQREEKENERYKNVF